jgi:hypothetical protein
MSFRDAASSVRAGIKSGAYQKKTDNFAAFAQGFAPVFAQQMKDKKDLKMAELKTIAEEKRWDRRQAAKAQAEIDKYDKKTLEVATQVASELGVDPKNTAAMAMITPFVAGNNNNFKSAYDYLKGEYNWSDLKSTDNSSDTSSAAPPAAPPAAVISQAVGWTDPLSKGEGNDNIDALYNLTKGKLSGKFANYKVSQNTIGANLDFARKGGESGYFDSSIGLVEGMPNAGTTPMGKWQFVHSTLEDIANRTNNFTDLGEGFENGLNTIFDAKAQDKIHAWYINDTLNQARKDGTNARDNFVRRLKARYEAFQKENPTTGNRFTDQEILDTVMPFVASQDKTTWATGGSWFGTVDYGEGKLVSNDVDVQTDAALLNGAASSSSSLPTRRAVDPLIDQSTGKRYPDTVIMSMAANGNEAAQDYLNSVQRYEAGQIDWTTLKKPEDVDNWISQATSKQATISPELQEQLTAHKTKLVVKDAAEKLQPIYSMNSTADVLTYKSAWKDTYGELPIPVHIQTQLDAQETYWKTAEKDASRLPSLTPEKAYMQKLQTLPVWKNLTETQKLDAMAGWKQYTSADMTNPAEVRESLRIATLIGDSDAVTRLTNLLNDDPNLMSKVYVVGEDGVGRLQWVNGKNELATGTQDKPVQIIPWTKEAGQFIQSRTGQMTTSVNAYNKKLGNVFSLANGMSEIIQITRNNPDVLTGTAGIVSSVKSILTNADTAFGVLSRMTEGDNTVTLSQYENALKDEGLLQEGESIDGLANQDLATSILGTEAVALAQARKILEAKLVIMQFRTGGAEGQSSTAMSNADRVEFFKFLKKFDKGSDLEMVYMDYLQGQLNSLEQDYSNTFSKEKTNAKSQLGFIPDYIFALSPEDAAKQAGPQMLSMYNAIKNRTSLPQNQTLLKPVTDTKPSTENTSIGVPRADPPQAAITDLNTRYAAAKTPEARALLLKQFQDHFKIDGSQYLTGDK